MQLTLKNLSFAIASAGMLTISGCGGGSSTTDPVATVTPVVVPEATALEQAQAFLALYDASYAKTVPTSGTAVTAFVDGCYLDSGNTKPTLTADFDSNAALSAESIKFRIGSTRTNVKILADRATTNTDGSSRRELDVTYQVNYADGTITTANTDSTLIFGSSAGAKMVSGAACATPQTATSWRFYGNRQIIGTGMRAINQRNTRFSLATGAPLTSAVDYNKSVQLRISDPGNVAKYVVVTGPGLPTSGVKMVSPRIQRDDPLFAGKRGNYVDWLDTDLFQFCRVSATARNVDGNAADCVAFGAAGNTYGAFNQTAALADTGFDALGFVAGAPYSIAVYNDDGWKTVNGQAAQTPIATVTQTLIRLPYSSVTLAGTDVGADAYPRMDSSVDSVQGATNIRAKTAFTTNLSWTPLGTLPDSAKFGLINLNAFVSGRATATTSVWPASRQSTQSYPAAGATSVTGYTFAAPSAKLITPTYGEISINLNDRNSMGIASLVTFE